MGQVAKVVVQAVDDDAEWRDFACSLRHVFRVHRAMMEKLLRDERPLPLELSEALENFANRYLCFAEQISDRWLDRPSQVE